MSDDEEYYDDDDYYYIDDGPVAEAVSSRLHCKASSQSPYSSPFLTASIG